MIPQVISTKNKIITASLIAFLLISVMGYSQQNSKPSNEYFTIEGYYKVKWGYADEFISLWKANHYPLLKKAIEKGDIISVTASKPKFHSGEDTRWDFRVIIVFRTVVQAFDENLTEPYKKQLYPDQETLKKAEQHRFELLISHWDIETGNVSLN
ncbi:MAG TPA: hypothetical protein VGZ90_10065 [Puia sp.]|jgi:hypothetical protein|nr:hypothetical protein [Puia sp.]